MLTAAVIGCGYWGPNLIRNFVQFPGVRMKTAVDLNKERLRHIAQLYPSVTTTSNADDVFQDLKKMRVCGRVLNLTRAGQSGPGSKPAKKPAAEKKRHTTKQKAAAKMSAKGKAPKKKGK